jgi:hypothetical protein
MPLPSLVAELAAGPNMGPALDPMPRPDLHQGSVV